MRRSTRSAQGGWIDKAVGFNKDMIRVPRALHGGVEIHCAFLMQGPSAHQHVPRNVEGERRAASEHACD
jgi:hypothetical protein